MIRRCDGGRRGVKDQDTRSRRVVQRRSDKLDLLQLAQGLARLGRGGVDRFHGTAYTGEGITDRNELAGFACHALFSHVSQTRQGQPHYSSSGSLVSCLQKEPLNAKGDGADRRAKDDHLDQISDPRRCCCTNPHWPARCQPTGFSPADAIRHWSAEGGHPIEDFAAVDHLTPLPGWAPGAKAISDDGFVSEERILHPALTMVP